VEAGNDNTATRFITEETDMEPNMTLLFADSASGSLGFGFS